MQKNICKIQIVSIIIGVGLNAPAIAPAAVNCRNLCPCATLNRLAASHMKAVDQIVGLGDDSIIINKGD